MDTTRLMKRLYPLLRRSVNYYLHLIRPGKDGKLHLPPTFSPEYGTAPDCNYDLALFRWGCQTLIDMNQRWQVGDTLQPVWQKTLQQLTPYPVNANGYMIGRQVPFAKSHRHYSHLFMIYPLHLLDPKPPENRMLIETSLNHWLNFKGGLQGYTFTGAASIAALLRQGTQAAGYLNQLLDQYIQPNTLYKEAGPVIETPLSAATSLQEMLLQSWGDRIRVFPAVPDAWSAVTFNQLRTEGAFLISAVRQGGQTQWIRVKSLAGQPCRLQTDLSNGFMQTDGGRSVPFTAQNGIVTLPLKRGETALLYRLGGKTARLQPVLADSSRLSYYGWNTRIRQRDLLGLKR